jgi:2-amino-4-hydroxy-6-hydroxymethyldihydropteridine diphosphokinase
MTHTYIGLGSNLHHPAKQIQSAIASLKKISHTQCLQVSSLYQNPPLKRSEQPDYVNAVAELKTELSAEALLQHLQEIESHQGRVRTEQQWGESRTLDLDILLFGNHLIKQKDLTIPHRELHTRNFFLYPLFEIAPELVLPSGTLLKDLINTCDITHLKKISWPRSHAYQNGKN